MAALAIAGTDHISISSGIRTSCNANRTIVDSSSTISATSSETSSEERDEEQDEQRAEEEDEQRDERRGCDGRAR